jgi:hypothetical protein
MVRKKIYGPKRGQTKAQCSKLRREKLHSVYSWPDIINTARTRYRWQATHVAIIGKKNIISYMNLVRKSEEKSRFGTSVG